MTYRWIATALVVAGVAGAAADTAWAQTDSTETPPVTFDPNDLPGTVEGMAEQLTTLQSDFDKLRRFKLSGYVQVRYEISDGDNDSVRVSGNPAVLTTSNLERFSIRRGRIKLTYDHSPWSQAVVYFDGGSDRQVRLLEGYAAFTEPRTPEPRWQAWIGQMNVPFGYEVERSSSTRELPERSRVENVLFPGERDRGLKLMGLFAGKVEAVAGVFNGGGIGDANFPNTDPSRGKELVGRVRAILGTVDFAVSGSTGKATTALTGDDVVTDRTRFGFDTQVYYALPHTGGGSLKFEVYRGHNANADSLSALTVGPTSANPVRLLAAGADPGHLATDFLGGYAMAVQNVGESFQLAARFDWFDPNEDVDHDRFERWNVALNAFYQGLTRVTVSYEHPITERRLSSGAYEDPVDNLWTLQVQHTF
jgi:hypothetical protein